MMEVKVKTLELENGNKVFFTAGPIYPYWKISFERGGVPEKLSGYYTELDTAIRAVQRHVETRHTRNRTTTKGEVRDKEVK